VYEFARYGDHMWQVTKLANSMYDIFFVLNVRPENHNVFYIFWTYFIFLYLHFFIIIAFRLFWFCHLMSFSYSWFIEGSDYWCIFDHKMRLIVMV